MSEKRTVQTILVAAESVVLSTSDFDWLYQAVQHNDQLTKELSLAEEGLANATQEIAHLHSRLAYRLQELDAIKRTRDQEKDYANTCYENERLREALADLRKGIEDHATDTVWYSPIETACDRITAILIPPTSGKQT
jgi:hypothetical protein